MPNGDKDWFASNAPRKAGGDWFASNAPAAVQTPDPTKPDPTAVGLMKGSGSKVATPYQMTNWFGPQPNLTQRQEDVIGSALPKVDPFLHDVRRNVAEAGGAMAGGEFFSGVSKGLPWLMRLLASSSGAGAGAGTGALVGGAKPKEALGEAAKTTALMAGTGLALKPGEMLLSKIAPKAEPLAKINKLLGVGEKDVMPGKTPASLDEFAANPARGAQKYGLDEAKLSKMNALERNSAIMQARDKAGKSLDQVLEAASGQGKKVNIQDVINDTFSEIADPKLTEQAEKRMLQILDKAGINKALRDLTPMEARTVQRGLDNFAKFANESEAKSFGDIADQLRSGISKETRKVVPESAEFDRDYTDLVRASNATQKAAREFATTVPENKLRKWLVRGIVTAGLGATGAAGYEGVKHWGTPVP